MKTGLNRQQLRKLVATLSDNEFDIVTDIVMDRWQRYPGEQLLVYSVLQLRVFFWEWLHHLGFTTDAQRRFLTQYAPLQLLTHDVAGIINNPSEYQLLAPAVVLIHDQRWFHVGRGTPERFVDLKYLRECSLPTELVVTSISCDLRALMLRKYALWKELTHESAAGPAPEHPGPRDPGQSSGTSAPA